MTAVFAEDARGLHGNLPRVMNHDLSNNQLRIDQVDENCSIASSSIL